MAAAGTLTSTQRSLLSRATSATSEPTPGYVYKDITDMVVANVSILPAVEDYLLQKLTRQEPYIKFKCLKLLKNLCTRLPSEFNRNKVCQSYAVIESRNYKAPYSEYNGDYLCHMVRNEVEDLLKVVYENQNLNHVASQNPSAQDRMVGFGNSVNARGSYSKQGADGNARFGGFGNSTGNVGGGNPGFQPSGVGNMGRSATTEGYGKPPGYAKMEGFGNYVPPSSGASSSASSQAFKLITDVATKYLPSSLFGNIERVGSAITTSAMDHIERHLSSNTDHHRQRPSMGHPTPLSHYGSNISIANSQYDNQSIKIDRRLLPSLVVDSNPQPTAMDDVSGESEAKLVKDILTFSGVKVTPSQQVLDDFMSKVKEVNVRYVIEELLLNLNNRSNKWQLQLRILCVLEALITQADVTPDVTEDMKRDLEPMLMKCQEESQLKHKAERLMQLIRSEGGPHARSENLMGSRNMNKSDMEATKMGSKAMDIFGDIEAKDQARASFNVPSDFTNPAFDLMDSFTPVSSVSSPKGKSETKTDATAKEDSIFDFDMLAKETGKRQASSEKDLFDVLDNIAFKPQSTQNGNLI